MLITKKIIITGAAGFIASCVVKRFSELGYSTLLVDDFSKTVKDKNTQLFSIDTKIDRELYLQNMDQYPADLIVHLGARTDTTEMNYETHRVLNLEYSKAVWTHCTQHAIPLIYASSAATYGDGQYGYDDNESLIPKLRPLNPYGVSKNEFDKFVLEQDSHPPFWYGLKFFNVYGPNEYHKERMASVILHAYYQISQHGKLNLFRSHNPAYEDGEQKRDFVYVGDVVKVIEWLSHGKAPNGIYNLGTGQARSFNALAKAVFSALKLKPIINYIDTPEDIREKYQYFTEANMRKLTSAGYPHPFMPLEEAVGLYVRDYLQNNRMY